MTINTSLVVSWQKALIVCSSPLDIKQWVYDTQNTDALIGEYTINIPISMNFLGCATSGTGDDSTNIIGWSTTSIIVKTFQSHQTDTEHQVRRPFHAILIGKN